MATIKTTLPPIRDQQRQVVGRYPMNTGDVYFPSLTHRSDANQLTAEDEQLISLRRAHQSVLAASKKYADEYVQVNVRSPVPPTFQNLVDASVAEPVVVETQDEDIIKALSVSSANLVLAVRYQPNMANLTQKRNKAVTLTMDQPAQVLTPSKIRSMDLELIAAREFVHQSATSGQAFSRKVAEIEKLIERARGIESNTISATISLPTTTEKSTPPSLPDTKEDKSRSLLKRRETSISKLPVTTTLEGQYQMIGEHDSRGRKPIRVIMQNLQKKVDLLRNNPVEMEAFLKRIESYKAEERFANRGDAIDLNRQRVLQYQPENRITTLQQNKKARDQRRLAVWETKHRLEQERLQYIMENIERKEQQVGREKNNRQRKAEMEHRLFMRKKWAILIIVGSRLYMIQEVLVAEQQRYYAQIKRHRAALKIQRVWRRYYSLLLEERQKNAVFIISRFMHKFIPIKRESWKHTAANVIRRFMEEAEGASRMKRVIKKFRHQVSECQRITRNFLAVRKSQVIVIERQLEQWLHASIETSESSLALASGKSTPGTKKSRSTGKENSKKSANKRREEIMSAPSELRRKVIEDSLIKKRKAFLPKLEDYLKKCELWDAKYRRRQALRTMLKGSNGGLAASTPNNPSVAPSIAPSVTGSRTNLSDSNSNLNASSSNSENYVIPGLEIDPKTNMPRKLFFSIVYTPGELVAVADKIVKEWNRVRLAEIANTKAHAQ